MHNDKIVFSYYLPAELCPVLPVEFKNSNIDIFQNLRKQLTNIIYVDKNICEQRSLLYIGILYYIYRDTLLYIGILYYI